jgi:predicted PhzF superfamily epimerase YddE/YHI9
MNYFEKSMNKVVFTTLSGDLTVMKKGRLYELEFPPYELKKVSVTDAMEKALGVRPLEAYMGRDLLCVFDNEDQIKNMKPDLEQVKQLDGLLLQVTAPGSSVECVSRSFAPKLNVSEDPVCGSGHCHIIPFWSKRLQKNTLIAYQASKRGGTLYCRFEDNKVFMAGEAALYSVAELNILQEKSGVSERLM